MEAKSGFTFKRVREQMVEMLLEMGIKDFRVLDAMSQIARHQFIDEAFWSRAYENRKVISIKRSSSSVHQSQEYRFSRRKKEVRNPSRIHP